MDDDVAFNIEAEAASCFGKHYEGLQLGWIPHPSEAEIGIWFPKLYANKLWRNRISGDGKTIWEISESPSLVREYVDRETESGSRYGWIESHLDIAKVGTEGYIDSRECMHLTGLLVTMKTEVCGGACPNALRPIRKGEPSQGCN